MNKTIQFVTQECIKWKSHWSLQVGFMFKFMSKKNSVVWKKLKALDEGIYFPHRPLFPPACWVCLHVHPHSSLPGPLAGQWYLVMLSSPSFAPILHPTHVNLYTLPSVCMGWVDLHEPSRKWKQTVQAAKSERVTFCMCKYGFYTVGFLYTSKTCLVWL